MELTIQLIIYGIILASFIFDWWLSKINYDHRDAPIPEEVSDIYDEKKYKRWQAYSMENHRFSKINKLISLLVFLLLLVSGGFVLFNGWAEALVPNNIPLQVVVFMAPYFLITQLIGIPLSYYQTFVIEDKYGFNKTTTKTFVIDKIKGFILSIIFGGGLLYLVAFIYIKMPTGTTFFLYTWLSLLAIFIVINILYVPVFVPLFNKLTPLEENSLRDKIIGFAESVGYEINKISIMDASKRSTKLNAFFAGFGKFKNIVLFDTLLNKMEEEEIVAVLAHEIGHNKHKHIIFNMIQMAFILSLYLGVLLVVLSVPEFSTAFGFEEINIGFSLILFMVLIDPISIVIDLVTASLSRKYEYQADGYAAIKYNHDTMIKALKVLTRENFANLTPHPLYVKLRYSHPPTADRIRAILEVK
ncbi:MAG: M48 family metallopeptidase [Candidatus Izimaplasma sp.]|nr:M48 family metallopeptidase [Candidatus Izimaplasma bacterium]